jgi:hypothetical protein
MSDAYSTVMVATVLLILICGWLLVNAIIDLSARHVRQLWSKRRTESEESSSQPRMKQSPATGVISRSR